MSQTFSFISTPTPCTLCFCIQAPPISCIDFFLVSKDGSCTRVRIQRLWRLLLLLLGQPDLYQPSLNLAPSLLILVLPIPRDTTQQPANSPSNTSQRATHTTHHIPFTQLAHASTQSTSNTTDSVVSPLTHVPHDTANGTSYGATKPSKSITNCIPKSLSYTRDSVT